jgi:hypothetical protein
VTISPAVIVTTAASSRYLIAVSHSVLENVYNGSTQEKCECQYSLPAVSPVRWVNR